MVDVKITSKENCNILIIEGYGSIVLTNKEATIDMKTRDITAISQEGEKRGFTVEKIDTTKQAETAAQPAAETTAEPEKTEEQPAEAEAQGDK